MANNENLKPFKKGQSGNPKGYPKGKRNMKTILRELLQEASPTKEAKLPLAEVIIKIALGGEKDSDKIKAVELILSKLEDGNDVKKEQFDLTKLTDKELGVYMRLVEKITVVNESS